MNAQYGTSRTPVDRQGTHAYASRTNFPPTDPAIEEEDPDLQAAMDASRNAAFSNPLQYQGAYGPAYEIGESSGAGTYLM